MTYIDYEVGYERKTFEQFFRCCEMSEEDVLHTEVSHDCKHHWVLCEHSGMQSKGSNPVCYERSRYLGYSHYVCTHGCGTERWPDNWGQTVENILNGRRLIEEIAQNKLI